jgi:putative membrane protein
MVLFWALIIVAIVALVRFTTDGTQGRAIPAPPHYSEYESPAQLLAGRFARGEIDETEYRHRLEVLRTTPHH